MYRLQSHWANCCTETAYLCSLATWTDAAKDHYFNCQEPPEDEAGHVGSGAAPGGPPPAAGAVHPFQLGTAPWVVRRHGFLFVEPRAYHSRTDYRSDLVISTAVTKLGRTSLDVEHAVLHERPAGGGRQLLARTFSSIVVLSPRDLRPAPHGLDAHSGLCAAPSFELPSELPQSPPTDAWQHALVPRFVDADGHGHVNNAVLLSYLQEARFALEARRHPRTSTTQLHRRLRVIRSLYVEFLQPAWPHEQLLVLCWGDAGVLDGHGACQFFEVRRGDGLVLLRARMDFAAAEPKQASSKL